jgi:predicted RNase H-like HicB family nuclease
VPGLPRAWENRYTISNAVVLDVYDERKARRPANLEDVPVPTQVFTAVLHKEENLYVAERPEVGTVSQGTMVKNAIAKLKEATELYLEEFPLPSVSRPIVAVFEAAVHG